MKIMKILNGIIYLNESTEVESDHDDIFTYTRRILYYPTLNMRYIDADKYFEKQVEMDKYTNPINMSNSNWTLWKIKYDEIQELKRREKPINIIDEIIKVKRENDRIILIDHWKSDSYIHHCLAQELIQN